MRTAKEIIEQTNGIARITYANRGYHVSDDFLFYTETINRHPYEIEAWRSACEIQELVTQTCIDDVFDELEDEEGE